MRVGDIGERDLLERIARRVHARDDAAILPESFRPVLTTDTLIEDVDFRLRWATWRDIGFKAAGANLSDLAAMAAEPKALLLSLALRSHDAVADVLSLVDAVTRYGRQSGAPLVGGDLSETHGPLVVALTAVGAVRGPPIERHLGQVGDILAVTGPLGGARAALQLLEAGAPCPAVLRRCLLRPKPRLDLAPRLAGLVRSGADISDGLLADAPHVCGRGTRPEIHGVPVLPAARKHFGARAQEEAIEGGEDFELVVAVPPENWARVQALGVHAVGVLRRGRASAAGFQHFVEKPAPAR
jgi:thiamine-monophosphate kinase